MHAHCLACVCRMRRPNLALLRHTQICKIVSEGGLCDGQQLLLLIVSPGAQLQAGRAMCEAGQQCEWRQGGSCHYIGNTSGNSGNPDLGESLTNFRTQEGVSYWLVRAFRKNCDTLLRCSSFFASPGASKFFQGVFSRPRLLCGGVRSSEAAVRAASEQERFVIHTGAIRRNPENTATAVKVDVRDHVFLRQLAS